MNIISRLTTCSGTLLGHLLPSEVHRSSCLRLKFSRTGPPPPTSPPRTVFPRPPPVMGGAPQLLNPACTTRQPE
uniref:Uncharacterized protein n=1 Tax=Lutzomyia longipalpis TaxID=7200 RepID=A0A1B0CAV5_LUTLO